MSELEILKWFVFGIMGIAMWFLKRNIDITDSSIKDLRLNIEDIRKTYVHKEDFKELKQELRSMFEEIRRDIKEIKHEKNDVAR